MKVTFVFPNLGRKENGRFVDRGRMEPLGLGILAALTPPDVDVALVDDRVDPVPYDEPTDLVAISIQIFTARRGYEIADAFRRRGVRVIIGGMHATLRPAEARRHADSVFIGDAEAGWAEVIEDVRKGALKPIYRAQTGTPQAGGIVPRRDLYRGKHYLPISLLQYGRGCRYACDFCAVSAYFERKHFYRPVADVVREIELQDRRFLFFVDDNIISDHEAARALFHALIPLRIHWVSQASLDMLEDPALMDLMMESGCLGHVVGFESIEQESLRLMRKAPNVEAGFDRYDRQIRQLRAYGLQTWAAFTLGHDHDTPESIRRTLDFALEHRFAFAAFNILMPYPQTTLYDRLARDDRLLYDGAWWLHPEYRFNHAAFRPLHMTPDELTEAGLYARKTFNSVSSILRRTLDPKTNLRSMGKLGLFLLYSPLFRVEALKKQGLHLGYD